MIEAGDRVQPTLEGLTWITSAGEANEAAQVVRRKVVLATDDVVTGWDGETERYLQFEVDGHWTPARYYERAP